MKVIEVALIELLLIQELVILQHGILIQIELQLLQTEQLQRVLAEVVTLQEVLIVIQNLLVDL